MSDPEDIPEALRIAKKYPILTDEDIADMNIHGIEEYSKMRGIKPETTRRYVRAWGMQDQVIEYRKKARKGGKEYTVYFEKYDFEENRPKSRNRVLNLEVRVRYREGENPGVREVIDVARTYLENASNFAGIAWDNEVVVGAETVETWTRRVSIFDLLPRGNRVRRSLGSMEEKRRMKTWRQRKLFLKGDDQ